jgi:hypothetical protein
VYAYALVPLSHSHTNFPTPTANLLLRPNRKLEREIRLQRTYPSPLPILSYPSNSILTSLPLQNTPRPAGRSVIACQRMMERLKGTLKTELDALMSGDPIGEGTPKKTGATTPRKRKAKGDEVGTPAKRGRKKKEEEVVEDAEEEEVVGVKSEVKEEEIEEDL